MNPEPHPDMIQDWKATKAIKHGGRQAIDTEAMEAYYDTFEATGDKEKAAEAMINVHQKYSRYAQAKK
jgi:hypothetical protein